MTESFNLYAKKQYIQRAVGDVDRSMTIAAFYVAQGMLASGFDKEAKLKRQPMRRDVLSFLMSPSAVSYWLDKQRLEKHPADDAWLCLTTSGLNEVYASFEANDKNSATPEDVKEWAFSMLQGGGDTEVSKMFQGGLLQQKAVKGESISKGEAVELMAGYYKANQKSLPSSIKGKREAIIALLMQGIEPENAFDQVVDD